MTNRLSCYQIQLRKTATIQVVHVRPTKQTDLTPHVVLEEVFEETRKERKNWIRVFLYILFTMKRPPLNPYQIKVLDKLLINLTADEEERKN